MWKKKKELITRQNRRNLICVGPSRLEIKKE